MVLKFLTEEAQTEKDAMDREKLRQAMERAKAAVKQRNAHR
jgi:hypothetical protein